MVETCFDPAIVVMCSLGSVVPAATTHRSAVATPRRDRNYPPLI